MLAIIHGISTRAHAQHVPCVTLGLESDWNSCISCLLGMHHLCCLSLAFWYAPLLPLFNEVRRGICSSDVNWLCVWVARASVVVAV